MGRLLYESRVIEIEDRLLAHLKIVIIGKLRRGECFSLNWAHSETNEGGRSTLWIHPYLALEFEFATNVPADINRTWLEALMVTANSMAGLSMLPEPEKLAAAKPAAGTRP
ncbi:MAG: hypothetical protein JWM51_1368 [Microbacteriaceae bacterium]|jgi:hypothetical protein|nr:hypothetical protein [Microbacteriaceae bacterium]